ncbi:unnamed protein product, partial [Closterium sp. NIES-53]
MFITLYFIVTRLPDSLRSTSVVAVGASRGTPRTPFFEGCSPSPLAPSYASAAAVDVPGAVDVGAASASAKRRSSKGKGGRGGGGGSGSGSGGSGGGGGGSGGGGSSGSGDGSGGFGSGGRGSGGGGGSGSGGRGGGRNGAQGGGSGGGQRQQQQLRSKTYVSCPYVIRTGDRAGQTCGRPHTQRRCFSRLDNAWRTEFGDEVECPRCADLFRAGVAIFDVDFDVILASMYALSTSAEGDYYRCVPPDPGIGAAALGASEYVLPGTAPTAALHTFTLDSSASRCFFRDSTTLTPLSAPIPVRLADPSGGPVVARASTLLPCPAFPSGFLSGLHLPSFSTNLVSTAALQDVMVTTTTSGGQRVSICTCAQTGRHLATFTRRPGSSLYTLATEPNQTLLWHHCLGHPSLPRLRGMHSFLFLSSLPRSLPPLPPSPAPPCLPCVKGRQRAAPHSSFPPTSAPLLTLHMDVWGPARISGQRRERYFLLDLPVLRLHSDRGGEFSSDQLRDFCHGEGILKSFTLPASPQQNGIAERHIDLVMEVARTSMIHAVAPHFLWSFAVRYAARQLNLWPRISLPETSPTQRWTGKVGDASVFRVWGSRAFVRDTSADKLSTHAIPCVFLGFVRDAPGWQFYHPTSSCVLPSQEVTFDESVPFCRPAPLGVSKVDPPPGAVSGEVAVDSGAARGATSGGAETGGAELGGDETRGVEPEGAKTGGAEPGGAEPEGVESGGVEPGGAEPMGMESGGAEPRGTASSGGPAGVSPWLSPRPEPLSPQQLHEWLTRRARLRSGAAGASDTAAGDAGAGSTSSTGVSDGAGGTGGAGPTGPGGAHTRGIGAAGIGGAGGAGAGGAGIAGGTGASGDGGTTDVGARGAGPGGAGAGSGDTGRSRPYFVPLLHQVLVARAAPPPPPSPPSPPSMGTEGRGCEGVADVPQQQQLPPRLLLSLSLPHLVLGRGGELRGLWSSSGGEGICSTSPPLLLPPPDAGAAVGGRGSAAPTPPVPPLLLHPWGVTDSGSAEGGRGSAAPAPRPPPPHFSSIPLLRVQRWGGGDLQPCAPCCPVRPARPAALQPCAPCCPVHPACPAPRAPCCPVRPACPAVLLPCAPCTPCSPARPARPASLQPCAPCCPAALCALLPCCPVRPARPAALRAPRALLSCFPARPAALCAPRALLPCSPVRPAALQPCAPCCPVRPARPAALRAPRDLLSCCTPRALLPCCPVRPAALCAPRALQPCAPRAPAAATAPAAAATALAAAATAPAAAALALAAAATALAVATTAIAAAATALAAATTALATAATALAAAATALAVAATALAAAATALSAAATAPAAAATALAAAATALAVAATALAVAATALAAAAPALAVAATALAAAATALAVAATALAAAATALAAADTAPAAAATALAAAATVLAAPLQPFLLSCTPRAPCSPARHARPAVLCAPCALLPSARTSAAPCAAPTPPPPLPPFSPPSPCCTHGSLVHELILTASALVAELVDFATASRLDYATALVAESASATPPSVG